MEPASPPRRGLAVAMIVLLLLAHKQMHGYEIMQRIRRLTMNRVKASPIPVAAFRLNKFHATVAPLNQVVVGNHYGYQRKEAGSNPGGKAFKVLNTKLGEPLFLCHCQKPANDDWHRKQH